MGCTGSNGLLDELGRHADLFGRSSRVHADVPALYAEGRREYARMLGLKLAQDGKVFEMAVVTNAFLEVLERVFACACPQLDGRQRHRRAFCGSCTALADVHLVVVRM